MSDSVQEYTHRSAACQDFSCGQEKKVLNQKLGHAQNDIAELRAKIQKLHEFYQGQIRGLEKNTQVTYDHMEILIQENLDLKRTLQSGFWIPPAGYGAPTLLCRQRDASHVIVYDRKDVCNAAVIARMCFQKPHAGN